MKNFSENLNILLKNNNISQNKLAKILNNSQQSISRYVNGVTEPDIHNLIKIANYFNVTTDYLLGLSDDFGNFVNNSLSEIENYFINILRQLNGEKKQELISYANYLINKDNKQTNSQNMLDISELSDLEKAEVIGFINGFKKQSFTSQGKIVNKNIKWN